MAVDNSAALKIVGRAIKAAIPYAKTTDGPVRAKAIPGSTNKPAAIIDPVVIMKTSSKPSSLSNFCSFIPGVPFLGSCKNQNYYTTQQGKSTKTSVV